MKNVVLVFFLLFSLLGKGQDYVVRFINFEGNKTTKESIILAELDFANGDTIKTDDLAATLDRNASRIYNLQLFHWVKHTALQEGNFIDITFSVQERWYIWPSPILSFADRNLNAWLNKMDFNRLDYGLHTAWYNFRGRNEQLISNIQHGFNRKYELFYRIPQINKKKNLGLEFGASYYQSHYIDYVNDEARPLTLRNDDHFPIKRKYGRIGLINRNTVENINYLRFEVNDQEVSDTVLQLNPNYHLTGNHKTYTQIELAKVMNRRNTFSYPLSGSFTEIAIRQRFFFQEEETPNTRIQVYYSKYLPISKKSYYAIGAQTQYLWGNRLSTSENLALGYKQQVRGFDYYVIDGQSFAVLKQNLNTTLIGDKKIKLNFIPSEKFNEIPFSAFIGVFADVGYVGDTKYEALNPLSNELMYSVGAGLQLISYYDQVFVLEYTLNSLNEHGIFVSTKFSF